MADWIAGGHVTPKYDRLLDEWIAGTLLVVGGGLLAAILSRRLPALWRGGASDPLLAASERRPWHTALLVATAALGVYIVVAFTVFSARPLLIDEVVQLLQARVLTEGRLWRPLAEHPEFFSLMHVVETDGRVFGQFPPGWPVLLAIGVVLEAPWLMGPLMGAASVIAFAAYLRPAEPRAGVRLGALLLFAFAPFVAFMSGSYMNHGPTLTLLLVAAVALTRGMDSPHPRAGLAALSGLAFGVAATIRPVDAFAFALPAGAWYLWRAVRDRRRWRDALAAAAGVALPILALLWYNLETTGEPLRFGYQVLWGNMQSLGFHPAPWGEPHTPTRGVELINIYFLRLQAYLFEAPLPSLLPLIGAFALAPRLDARDRYLLASSALLVVLYFAYWHDGFWPGPRFMYPLAPALALWTARFPALVRDRFGAGVPYRAAIYGYALAALIALGVGVPLRAREYRNAMLSMRWDPDSAATAAGVSNALVFVRESWGAQIVARLWALGIPRSETELLYRTVDSCILEHAIGELERRTERDADALALLRPLMRDSARVVRAPYSTDPTLRLLPGLAYSERCLRRIADDRAGFMLFPMVLLASAGDNVYARDLHDRNRLLLDRFADRPVYVLRPPSTATGEPPRFHAVSRDSLRRVWEASP